MNGNHEKEGEPRVLIIDSAVDDCNVTCQVLTEKGYEPRVAHDADAALKVLSEQPMDLVLLDSAMPGGVDLIGQLRSSHSLPIIVISSSGYEQRAIQAIQSGASSYVPKDLLNEELDSTIRDVLEVSQQKQFQLRLLDQMAEFQCKFVLENDRALVPPLVSYLQEHFKRTGICQDDSELMRIGIALDEALTNAIYHGNLDLDSALREDGDRYYQLAAERSQQEPYKDRRLYIEALVSREVAEIMIRDEGAGFDPSSLPDPRDPANMEKVSGRGVLLMRTFMDDVQFNNTGNAVILRKYSQDTLPEQD